MDEAWVCCTEQHAVGCHSLAWPRHVRHPPPILWALLCPVDLVRRRTGWWWHGFIPMEDDDCWERAILLADLGLILMFGVS